MLSQRIFAALYDPLTGPAEKRLPEYRAFVAGQAQGRVLEIGAGTGANLPFYPPGVSLTLADPNPFMLRRLRARAARLGVRGGFLWCAGESLPLPNASFDTVVGTLVLCSVADQGMALREVARVLHPCGRFRFLEHVRAESARWGRFQDAVTPVWKRLGGGCHPNRSTVEAMRSAGLEVLELRAFKLGPYPTRPFVAGAAERALAP